MVPHQSASFHWKQTPTPFSGKGVAQSCQQSTNWVIRLFGTFSSNGYLHFLQDELLSHSEDFFSSQNKQVVAT
jgi:hypothetical protein